MTDEQIALGERAVACKGWRWMPGMVMLWPSGVVSGYWLWARPMIVGDDGAVNWWEGDPPAEHADGAWQDKAVPDLTDAATLGCLLALVREAWQNPHIWVESSTGWACIGWAFPEYQPAPPDIVCPTEAEVLVAALEAAP